MSKDNIMSLFNDTNSTGVGYDPVKVLYTTTATKQKMPSTVLLFISYKFVKGFLVITFLLLFFPTETYMICVNIFYLVINEISAGSDKRQRISPLTLHCKNRPLW